MSCNCNKPKCDGKCGISPSVLQINNPGDCTLFHRIEVPASMGDSTTNPPKNGDYRNVLLYYVADGTSWFFSSDGIPQKLVNGFTNYEDAINLPQINGITLLGDKSSADLKLADAPVVINMASNASWSSDKTAEEIFDAFNAGTAVVLDFGTPNVEGMRVWPVTQLGYNDNTKMLFGVVTYASTENGGEFTGIGGYGVFNLYDDNSAEVNDIEWQRALSVVDDTGLSFDGETLSGLPATDNIIGMVKPGDGLEVASDGAVSISDIGQYAHFFDTVADMRAATNLVAGDYARTLGYTSTNDGGGALYKIRTITNDDVVDNAYIIEMADNTLVAELIRENNSVNIRQLGGKENEDISTILTRYMAMNGDKHKLYIPAGNWVCNEIELSTWFDINGDSKFVGKTFIRPAVEEQAYIFKISSDNGYGWSLSGLHFETGKDKALTDSVIWLNNTSYGQMKDMTFQNVVGQCIRNVGSFEINFYNTIARGCYPQALGDTTGLFTFKSTSSRIPSTLYFDYIQCEQIFGNIFFVNSDTLVANNKIGSINIEQPLKTSGQSETRDIVDGLTLTSVLDEADTSIATIGSYKHHAILTQTTSTQVAGLTIDSIDYNNAASCVWNLNGNKYIFDCCIQKSSSEENTNINFSGKIGNSTMIGLQKDFYLVNTRNKAVCRCSDTKNNIIFGDVEYAETGSNKCVFAVHSEYNIKAGNIGRPNDSSANTEGFIECNTLTAPIETYYSITCGCQEYRDNAISKGLMVLRPKTAMNDGGGFKAIAGGNKLLIRYASTATTNIIVRDLDQSNNQTQITVNNTGGNFVWVTFDLGTNITDYALGDTLRIGASSGAVSFDVIKFI